ncbi:MAG TPA: adenylate cyclase [Cyanobacteria bacterium UBA11369]|nr:adenylate cyclase [Cyanobacteria bacterium UBA11371]HBE48240.1 adenylate cyclase [Cyanobacteria bacterium UBA11369]
MTELKLCLYIEDNIEKTVTVQQDEFILGRLPDCDLYLPYIGISRHQARIFNTSGGEWFIEDMGSKNGTLLNGEFLTEPRRLNNDDLIALGTISIRVFLVNYTTVTQNKTDIQAEEVTIIRNVQYLQQQWIPSDRQGDKTISQELTIVRLKDLLEIAKKLNYAASIEAIFQAAQAVVFRYIQTIERLALLIDVSGTGKLCLFNASARDITQHQSLKDNPAWISRTICYKVFTEKIALQTADAQGDDRFNNEQSIIDKGIHSVMAVPLWDENNVVGVLYADSYQKFNHSIHESEEDISFFSTLANLVASSVQRWLLTRKLRSEEISRQRLQRYLSPAVVQQTMMAGNLENGRLAPQESEISILFADIVGFTALSERLTPAQIAELLNSFFEEMLQEIFAANGTLDKFIGDCIMAFFGAPEPQEDHAERALNVAKAMLERLENLNNHQVLSEPLQLRIAINSGKAVVGDVGSSQRVDYTVLGTTINLASRIQSVCLPGRCAISENTYNLLRPSQRLLLDDIGERRFKGIEKPVRIYQTMKRGILD